MFRATLIHHLALVKCSAAAARDATGRLTDGLAALQARTTPDVHGDTAVHVLVVDCKFQRIARDVLLVAAIKLHRQRIHLREPLDREAQESVIIFEIGPDICIKLSEKGAPCGTGSGFRLKSTRTFRPIRVSRKIATSARLEPKSSIREAWNGH
jgi:hypothetical protein